MRRTALGTLWLVAACFEDSSPDSDPTATSAAAMSTGSETAGTASSQTSTSTQGTSTGGGVSTDAATTATTDDGSSSAAAPCETVLVEEAVLDADTAIDMFSCAGTVHQGSAEFLNIGLGAGLFRFRLSPASRDALVNEEAVGLELILSRDFGCINSGCPAEDGSLEVRPLRSDWTEGMGDVIQGADWCRRSGTVATPMPWGADGAQLLDEDVGTVGGSATFDTLQPSVTVPLESVLPFVEPWIVDDGVSAVLSLRVGADAGVFVAASRENPDPAEDAPRLRVRYCET